MSPCRWFQKTGDYPHLEYNHVLASHPNFLKPFFPFRANHLQVRTTPMWSKSSPPFSGYANCIKRCNQRYLLISYVHFIHYNLLDAELTTRSNVDQRVHLDVTSTLFVERFLYTLKTHFTATAWIMCNCIQRDQILSKLSEN